SIQGQSSLNSPSSLQQSNSIQSHDPHNTHHQLQQQPQQQQQQPHPQRPALSLQPTSNPSSAYPSPHPPAYASPYSQTPLSASRHSSDTGYFSHHTPYGTPTTSGPTYSPHGTNPSRALLLLDTCEELY